MRPTSFRNALLILGIIVFYGLFAARLSLLMGGYQAQDFDKWFKYTKVAAYSGVLWVGRLVGEPEPPLFFLSGGTFVRAFGEVVGLKLAGACFIVLNCLSLHLCWICSRRILSDKERIFFLSFVATLPIFVLTSVVYAPDVLCFFFFFLICVLNLCLLDTTNIYKSVALMVASCAIQISGGFTKHTFLGIAPAMLIMSVYLAVKMRKTRLLAFAIPLVLFFAPTSVNYLIAKYNQSNQCYWVRLQPEPSGGIYFRSLLFPYLHDIDLFNAPMSSETMSSIKQIGIPINPRDTFVDEGIPIGVKNRLYTADHRPILANNHYSYPGLFNLAIYTDINNISRIRLLDTKAWGEVEGRRNMVNQRLQQGSVRLGTLFSLIFVISLGCFCVRIFIVLISRIVASQSRIIVTQPTAKTRQLKYSPLAVSQISRVLSLPPDKVQQLRHTLAGGITLSPGVIDFTLAVLIPALGYYGLLVGSMPFLSDSGDVYCAEYWWPRLIAPALLAFGIVGFWGLFRLAAYFHITTLVQVLICAQIILDISIFIF